MGKSDLWTESYTPDVRLSRRVTCFFHFQFGALFNLAAEIKYTIFMLLERDKTIRKMNRVINCFFFFFWQICIYGENAVVTRHEFHFMIYCISCEIPATLMHYVWSLWLSRVRQMRTRKKIQWMCRAALSHTALRTANSIISRPVSSSTWIEQ